MFENIFMHGKKILLVDVDSTKKWCNIACCKLNSFLSTNNTISFMRLNNTAYSQDPKKHILDCSGYDLVFVSIIFENNKNAVEVVGCNEVYFGGVGFDVTVKLPPIIDHVSYDYSLYDMDFSVGTITRGCIRNCYFCKVPLLEGKTHYFDHFGKFVRHRNVALLDNNLFSYPQHKRIIEDLKNTDFRFHFCQGNDIRLMTKEISESLVDFPIWKEWIFAFDDLSLKPVMDEKLNLLDWVKDWKLKFYVYVAPHHSISSVMERIQYLVDRKIKPYIMRDRGIYSCGNKEFYVDLAAYYNQPNIFKKMDFETFVRRRHPKNSERVGLSLQLFGGDENIGVSA